MFQVLQYIDILRGSADEGEQFPRHGSVVFTYCSLFINLDGGIKV